MLNIIIFSSYTLTFQECFQNKMTGCASEFSEDDLCLYSLLGLALEKPRLSNHVFIDIH